MKRLECLVNEMLTSGIEKSVIIKELKKIEKRLKPAPVKKASKPKNLYKHDISVLNYIKPKKSIRNVLLYIQSKNNNLIATDLENSMLISNDYDISDGLYSKTNLDIKNYNKENLDITEYPNLNFDIRSHKSFNISSEELLDFINRTLFASSKSDEDITVKCLKFEKGNVYASDTYRLIKHNINIDEDINFSLCRKTAEILQRDLKKLEDINIKISYNDDEILFEYENRKLKARLSQFAFLDAESIFASLNVTNEIKVNVQDLIAALEKCNKTTSYQEESKYSVKMILENDNIKLTTQDYNESIKSSLISKELNINYVGLNGNFILEYLKTLNSEYTNIKLHDDNRSAIMFDDCYITMPVHL